MLTNESFDEFLKGLCNEFAIPHDGPGLDDRYCPTSHFKGITLSYQHKEREWILSAYEHYDGAQVSFKWKPKYFGGGPLYAKVYVCIDVLEGYREDLISDIITPGIPEVLFRLFEPTLPSFVRSMDDCKQFIRKIFQRFAQDRDLNYAASKIQRAWRRCRDNPEYKMCTRVRMRDVEDDNDGVFVRG